MFSNEPVHYDLTTVEGLAKYSEAVEERAEKWAENFEEGGQGDGEPFQLGEGLDLWIVLTELWEDEFSDQAVNDIDIAQQIGEAVCEQVIVKLISKRK